MVAGAVYKTTYYKITTLVYESHLFSNTIEELDTEKLKNKIKMEAHYFTVNLDWTSDRKGKISSPELDHEIEVATPPVFPNGIEGIWSPEHLLTAAVVSCYMTTFLAVAENSKLVFDSFKCDSKGKLEQVEGKFLITEIVLTPTLVIMKETDMARAQKILEKSEAACLISNSIKSKVVLAPIITISEVVS